jgi:hypothetical protein
MSVYICNTMYLSNHRLNEEQGIPIFKYGPVSPNERALKDVRRDLGYFILVSYMYMYENVYLYLFVYMYVLLKIIKGI